MYHITKDGSVAECKAQPGNCPLGDIETHFATIDEAYAVMGDIFGFLSYEDLVDAVYYDEFVNVMSDDNLREIFINQGMIGDVRVNPGFIFRSLNSIKENDDSPSPAEMILWSDGTDYWVKEDQDELELSNLELSNPDLISGGLSEVEISDEVRSSLIKSKLIESDDKIYLDEYGIMIGVTTSSGEVYVIEPEDFLGAANEMSLYSELSSIYNEPSFERSLIVEDLIYSSEELREELKKIGI